MRITNNGLVGIGTSTPTYKLQVAGSLLATTIGAGATDPNYALYTNGKFGVGSTAYFASYVGIGTTNPSSKLNIVGANSTSALLTIEDNSYAAVVNSLYLKNINTADNNGNAIYMGYGGTMGGYGVRILQRGYPASTLSSDLLFQIHNSTAGNTDSSWDTPLFIQRITGNVGIGTTNPLSTLNIVSAEIGTGSNKGFRIDNYNLTKSYSLRTGISGSENTSFSIYDETASANRLTISTDGNINILKNITIGGTFVSVGSTNLVTNLNADVLDGYHASAFVQVGSTGSYIYTASNGITLASNNFKLGGAITENTRLNIGSTEVLYIDYATGRIGIGTTAPTYPFEIKSSYSGGLISGVTNLSSDTSSSARFQLLNDRNSTSLNQAYFAQNKLAYYL